MFFEVDSEMIPPFELPLDTSNIGETLTKQLEHILDTEEKTIMEMYPAFTNKYTNENPESDSGLEDWVTNRAFEYNLLNMSGKYPELNLLKQKILESYRTYASEMHLTPTKVYIQVWFNVLRKNGRFFTKHHHAHPSRLGDPKQAYVSGHICIRADNTHTYYYSPYLQEQRNGLKNIPGTLTLFPSWVLHSTDQNISDQTRLTIAFDIITEKTFLERKMDNPDNYIELA